MEYRFEPLDESHQEPVVKIFNSFVTSGFAAYPEQPLPVQFYGQLLQMAKGYPAVAAVSESGEVMGFGMLRRHHPFSVFDRCAEVSYFLSPKHTRKGLGGAMLRHFEEKAREIGVDTILASISSRNEESIAFHKKHGFEEVGRFRKAGRKFSKDFDIVWMQRWLSEGE
ncbi:GNAT family N-acetyltransferase [Elusimicrobiota bacterium]